MLRVAMINPRIPPASMNFALAMDLVGTRFAHIPLPLATLAALTPSDVQVTIIDENVEDIDMALEADIVAMTGIYCQRLRLFELADHFRERGITVVLGGALVADRVDDCREHADVIFIGEAEYTWPEFIDDFRNKAHRDLYEQTGWVDMADSPIPRFDLLKADRYASGCVQATRGCPYRCEYCDVPAKYGGRPRSKSIDQVIEEIRILANMGFDSIFMVDDHFVGNRKYAKALLRAIAKLLEELDHPVYFYTQVTLNVAKDDEIMELFNKADFRRFFVGIETPNPVQLRAINKKHNLEFPMMEAVQKIQSYNITVWAGIIVGLDDDGFASAQRQLEFIDQSGVIPTLVGLYQAVPGTPLWERAAAEDRIIDLPDIVGSAAQGTMEAIGLSNLVPRGQGEADVLRSFAWLVRQIYDPLRFGERLILATKRGSRRRPSPIDAFSIRKLKIVQRTMKWYLTHPDKNVRALLKRVLAAFAGRKIQGLEEILFHLAVFKHFLTFYEEAADIAEARADELDAVYQVSKDSRTAS